MSWRETIHEAWTAIVTHRARAFLTVLGILIGIAAVIVTVGLGEGSSASVTSAISALGSNLLIVTPGSTTSSGVAGGLGSASTLTLADAKALGSHLDCPDIAAVAPVVDREEVMSTLSGSNWDAPVEGTTPAYFQVRDLHLAEGSFMDSSEVTKAANVVVIGPEVASELFGFSDPVGQQMDIGSLPFQVIGVWAEAGSSSSTNLDDQVVVPITTAQSQLFGTAVFASNPNAVQQILIQSTSQGTLGSAYTEADDLLLQLHQISSPAAADFTITPETQLLNTATSVSRTLTILLAGIAGISLLVGGIGVMNIMLVSVSERVREIGLRKALGATPSVIRRQFVMEAGMLGLAGGVVGVALGIGSVFVLPHLISDTVELSTAATLGSVLVAALIGIVFGVYPASRAARLSPIDALRSE